MTDIGLTHIALPVADIDRSIRFYSTYAGMEVIHHRTNAKRGTQVAWLWDQTRPFAIVLIEADLVHPILSPFAHLGVACQSRQEMNTLCDLAKQEGILIKQPQNSGHPVGYWAFLRDPDGHTLELSYGQEIGLKVEKLTDTQLC